MLGEVGPVVAARIEMKFVRDAAGEKEFVEGFRAAVEAEVVGRAAIEVDAQVLRVWMVADDSEGAFADPVSGVERRAESGADETSDGHFLRGRDRGTRRILDERGTMSGDRAE